MAITQFPGHRGLIRRKNKDFAALTVLRRAMAPKAACLLNGIRYFAWNLNSYAPRNTRSYLIMGNFPKLARSGGGFTVLNPFGLYWARRLRKWRVYGHPSRNVQKRSSSQRTETMGVETSFRRRLTRFVWSSESSSLRRSLRGSPDGHTRLRCGRRRARRMSATIEKDTSWRLCPEKAEPSTRRRENVKGTPWKKGPPQ